MNHASPARRGASGGTDLNTRNMRQRLLATTTIGGAVLMTALTMAAAPAAAQDATEVEEIVITGSRIARQDYQAASPIVTVSQEDFQATGSVTIDTLINDLPQFVPSINQTSNNPSNGGQANINLRGLGTTRTLVLMNGRRVVASNSTGVVDINIFPTALIQNVEVITGGASAAYGSDALAGVANFILRDDFEGVQFDAQYGITDENDGETQSYSVTIGGNFDNGRGNAVMSLGRSTRENIFNSARDFSSISGPSGTSPLGATVFDSNNLPDLALVRSYFGSSTLLNTGTFGFNNDGSLFAYTGTLNFKSPGGVDYDGFVGSRADYVYNTGALNYLQLPLDRWNAYAGVNYEIAPQAEVYANFLFTEYEAAQELAATPAAGAVPATGFRVPSTNPFIPADLRAFLNARPNPASSFRLDKRFTDIGGRRSTENYSVYQGTVGIRGDLVGVRDWSYDFYMQYGRVDRLTTQSGNVSRSAVQTLLDAPDGGASICAGGFDPFGESNLSAACATYISRSAQNVTVSEQTVSEFTIQGSMFTLPAGDARFAAGVQYRQDDYAFRPDASLAQRNPIVTRPDGGQTGGSEIAGFNPSQPLSGSVNVLDFFGEVLIPVLADLPFVRQLDVGLGYRTSEYSSIGQTDAYKVDVDWEVFDGVTIRGGFQNAVRAPSIGELFAPINTSFPSIGAPSATGIQGDPCDIRSSFRTGANAAQVRALCLAQGISASAIDTYTYSNNQVPGVTGGNPDLTEETSESFTVGLVWQSRFDNPWLAGLSAAIDYYDIEITDVVGTIGAASQLQGCFNAQGQNPTFDANNVYCQLFSRDPLSGNVNNAVETNANLATLLTSGVDLQVDWRADMGDIGLPAWGSLDLNVVVGWLENRESQVAAGNPFIDRTGTIDSVFGNTFPEWKSLTGLNWRNGDFTVGARWRRVGEMTQFGTTNVIPTTDYFDLLGSWAVNDSVALRVTVNNLTDEQPPVYSPGVQANTDPSTYDTLGRRYSIGLTARF
jgi:iron complex outermembrane receptor protein